MTSVEEVIGALHAARKLADDAIEQATAARVQVEQAVGQFQAATRGSGRPEVRATHDRWAAAHEHLDNMIGRLLSGRHAIDIYTALIAGPTGDTTAGQGPQPDTAPAEQITRAEDRARRRARLRRELVRRGDDVIDATRTTTEALQNLVHPPTHQQPAAPDVAAGLVAGGIVAAEAAARVGRALRRLKEKHDHHDG